MECCFPVTQVTGETYAMVIAVMYIIHRYPRFKVNVYPTMPTRVMM